MTLFFDPRKFPYLIPLVHHSDIPSQIYLSLPKFLSAAHSYMLSRIYLSLPKNYPSIQVQAPACFHQNSIQILQVRCIHHYGILLCHQKLSQEIPM